MNENHQSTDVRQLRRQLIEHARRGDRIAITSQVGGEENICVGEVVRLAVAHVVLLTGGQTTPLRLDLIVAVDVVGADRGTAS